jgi:MYXO-CTERM domain-containing protein
MKKITKVFGIALLSSALLLNYPSIATAQDNANSTAATTGTTTNDHDDSGKWGLLGLVGLLGLLGLRRKDDDKNRITNNR